MLLLFEDGVTDRINYVRLLLDIRTFLSHNSHMQITSTQLRSDLYNLLNHILETGQPLEVIKNNQILVIHPKSAVSKIDRLKKRKAINGNPDSIVENDWSKKWKPSL